MKSALFAAAMAAVLLSGCASGVQHSRSGLAVEGRVVSAAGVPGMYGDVEILWASYAVEPEGQVGRRVILVDERGVCGLSDAGGVYRFQLYRRPNGYSFPPWAARSLRSDWFVLSCEVITPDGAG